MKTKTSLKARNANTKRFEKLQEIKDRFFLEEIIFRLSNKDMEYVHTLLNDWMKEKIDENPLTEKQRKDILKKSFDGGGHFKSEKELKKYIGLK